MLNKRHRKESYQWDESDTYPAHPPLRESALVLRTASKAETILHDPRPTAQTRHIAKGNARSTDNTITHLQNRFSQILVIPLHSSRGGILKQHGLSSSTTELYEVRSCSYFSWWPAINAQANTQCARCFLGNVKGERPAGSQQMSVECTGGTSNQPLCLLLSVRR